MVHDQKTALPMRNDGLAVLQLGLRVLAGQQ